ncbi:hypothetical protein BC937DRAFT_93013 [Endogone sp. FLAS-F59071]|nr:hypothetical protein BC937DRAFT_93013 [Endogone sp. FLAS-F59071]|eukprot:RUS21330.1 hypothetical protein BC937DRAFT_93013 [Endogone sp. FLAS-F59071]
MSTTRKSRRTSVVPSVSVKETQDPTTILESENLVQGTLYIVKINLVKLALFEGWNDDMCCFSLLREDSNPMRWSDARYLPGEFVAYEAFDPMGNPPMYLWDKVLKSRVPKNWFDMYEEARRKQRDWQRGFGADDDSELAPPQVYELRRTESPQSAATR